MRRILIKGRVWSHLNEGTSSTTDAIMDCGCTSIYPVTTKTITDIMKAEIKPLRETLTLIVASDNSLDILGTVKIFLEAEVLGGKNWRRLQ